MNNQSTMTVRRPKLVFPDLTDPVFIKGQPELSFLLIALSLPLPYEEPYMIRVMGKAKHRVTDPKLREAITLFNGQEAQHYRLHSSFNKATGVACPALADLEAELERYYERQLETRSLKWNLAFVQGGEALTVAFARFVLEGDLLRGADPAVRDLFEWHALEELEHRSVSLDVYEHLYGGYAYRLAVGAYAFHVLSRSTTRVMDVLLEQDRARGRDRGSEAEVRARQRALNKRLVKDLLPKALATFSPGYSPHKIKMPVQAGAVLQRLAGRDPIAELAATEPAESMTAA